MFQLASGRQHQRVFSIRGFRRRDYAGRGKAGAALIPWEPVTKHNSLARVGLVKRRIGHNIFCFQTFPGDVFQRFHRAFHLGKHFARTFICPVKPKPLGKLDGDPPILFGLTRRCNRCPSHLHLTIGVGHRAGLFGPG